MILELKDISVRFTAKSQVQAVEDVSLSIEDRSKVAIVGETGSGKSILLLAILCLLPEDARVSGQVLFEGRDLLRLTRPELDQLRGSEISYIPQGSGNAMNPLYSVGFQVAEPMMEHKGLEKKTAFVKAVELLKKFKLGDEERIAKQYPHTYSGGMRQRALIAMGIGAGARMLLADEPTKGLDEERVDLVVDSFRMLADKTILCVTHDLNFAQRISDHICVMYAASQVEYGPTQEMLDAPLHPYTRDMIMAMPEYGLHASQGFAVSHEDYGTMGCKYAPRCSDCFEKCNQVPPVVAVGDRLVRCWKYVQEPAEKGREKGEGARESADRGSD